MLRNQILGEMIIEDVGVQSEPRHHNRRPEKSRLRCAFREERRGRRRLVVGRRRLMKNGLASAPPNDPNARQRWHLGGASQPAALAQLVERLIRNE